MILVGGLTVTRLLGARGDVLDAEVLPVAALVEFGKLEVVDPADAITGSASALEAARSEDYGRPGMPEAVLVRVVDADAGLIPIERGRLLWVFRWAGLHEEDPRAFPGPSGKPNETVFLHTEYFVFVDASTGRPIADVLR